MCWAQWGGVLVCGAARLGPTLLGASPPTHPPRVQEVDSYASDLASLRDGMASAAGDLQVRVLDHMQGLQDEWQPTADRLDVA